MLAWNFRDEIAKECSSYGYRDKFLVAFSKENHIIMPMNTTPIGSFLK